MAARRLILISLIAVAAAAVVLSAAFDSRQEPIVLNPTSIGSIAVAGLLMIELVIGARGFARPDAGSSLDV